MLPVRDQRTLLSAFATVYRTFPHARLLLVGDGPERPMLEAEASKRGLMDVVIFTGYSDEIGSLLSAMDLYVNPTLDEGFGIAVVEAMLAGLPTLLSNCGAHPELLLPEKTGWLYEGGNSAALATRLQTIIQDVNRHRVAEAGRRYAQAHFSPARYAEQYVKAAELVVGRRRAHAKAA
jgi:glycosyltransferase involved in cell wall biosynthesis